MPERFELDCSKTTSNQAIVYIRERGAIALASKDTNVRIYNENGHGNRKKQSIFEAHKASVVGLVHLGVFKGKEIMASIDVAGTIHSWKTMGNELLGTIQVGKVGNAPRRFERLNRSSMAIGLESGRVQVITHSDGRNLKLSEQFNLELDCKNPPVCRINDNLVAVYAQQSIQLLNNTDAKLSRTLKLTNVEEAVDIVVNDMFLAVAFTNGKILVRENGDNYVVRGAVDLNDFVPKGKIAAKGMAKLSFAAPDLLVEQRNFLPCATYNGISSTYGFKKSRTCCCGDGRFENRHRREQALLYGLFADGS